MLSICGAYTEEVFSKFEKDEDGNFFNRRLEYEANRRKAYTESRRSNAKKKVEEVKEKKKTSKKGKDMPEHMQKHMVNHMENENENENKDKYKSKVEIKNDQLKESWADWLEYKRTQFKFSYKSEKSERTGLKILMKEASNDIGTACAIIEQSIGNGWVGFQPLKDRKTGKAKFIPNQPDNDWYEKAEREDRMTAATKWSALGFVYGRFSENVPTKKWIRKEQEI